MSTGSGFADRLTSRVVLTPAATSSNRIRIVRMQDERISAPATTSDIARASKRQTSSPDSIRLTHKAIARMLARRNRLSTSRTQIGRRDSASRKTGTDALAAKLDATISDGMITKANAVLPV